MVTLPPIENHVRYGTAVWNGTVVDGSGTMRAGANGYDLPYSLLTSTDETQGTSSEELLGAAHAGCYAMALAHVLEDAGHFARSLNVRSAVTLDDRVNGLSITKIDLHVDGDVDLTSEELLRYALRANETSAVSKLFASAGITVTAAVVPN